MNREETIFDEALNIKDIGAREAYVQSACTGDQAMFQRVRGLLRAHERAGKFLDPQSPDAPGPPPGALDGTAMLPPAEQPGDRIGRYKLLEQIGEGGCGVVYMAEQEESIRRRVALKIIKLGMDTRQVIARFEAERQALALMDHPNIARVHDAGATGKGRPYFVMELVRGLKITDYCDEKKLSTRERLELFILVCQAVQHAHQKGIIHRDLKPSNILVTVNDGIAVPKVIDFGIAKAAAGQSLTDKTIFTAFEQFIGTPAYMSPEQAEITSVDIDTRSDIYSLGVLLYELLTGQTPFEPRELLQAGLDEMRRTLREKTPPRPSTRLSTLGAPEQTTAAHRRGLDSARLVHLLRGDLDWIVMKCLAKDRARRYETANGLALDIHRHLNNQPVIARPPSRVYEFQRMVRRHWVGFAASAAILASLVAGLVVSTILYFRESEAKDEARAAESGRTAQLRNALLSDAKALRLTTQAGRRFDALQRLQRAAAISPSPELRNELRNEAIASMALTDIRTVKEVAVAADIPDYPLMVWDPDYKLCAIGDKKRGIITLRRLADWQEVTNFSGYATPLFEFKLSANGKFLLTSYGHNHECIEVRDLTDAKISMTFSGEQYRTAEFSQDGRLLAVSFESETNQNPIKIFDVSRAAFLGAFPHDSLPYAIAFNPKQSDFLISSDLSHAVRLWNWKTKSVVRTFPHPGAVRGIAWGPDGRTIAAACSDCNVWLWDTVAPEPIGVLRGHESTAVSVTFSADGALLASRGWEGRLSLWDVAGRREVARTDAPGGILPAVSFSQHGRLLGLRTTPERIKVLDATDGCGYRALRFPPEDQPVGNCDFSPDGRLIVSAHPNTLHLWDTASGKNLLQIPHDGGERVAHFYPDGKSFCVGALDGVEEWTLESDSTNQAVSLKFQRKRAIADRKHDLSFDLHYQTAATIAGGAVHVSDIITGMDRMRTPVRNYEFCTMSHDGRLVAAWTKGSVPQVDIWDASGARTIRSVRTSHLSICAEFSPDDKWLAIGDESEYTLSDVDSWTRIWTVPREYAGFWGFLSFSPDSKMLAVAISRSTAQLRDAATGKEIATLESPEPSQITGLKFSQDGTHLAVICSSGTIQLWDLPPIRRQLASMNLDWKDPAGTSR